MSYAHRAGVYLFSRHNKIEKNLPCWFIERGTAVCVTAACVTVACVTAVTLNYQTYWLAYVFVISQPMVTETQYGSIVLLWDRTDDD